MSKTEQILEFLREEGYKAHTDDDGDIVFKCQGKTLLFMPHEDDDEYFHLVLPAFWDAEGEEFAPACAACSQLNARLKVAKVFIPRDSVWATAEMFISPFEGFKAIFDRTVNLLTSIPEEFRRIVNELEGSDEDEDEDEDEDGELD
jgi:hypothetical protein